MYTLYIHLIKHFIERVHIIIYTLIYILKNLLIVQMPVVSLIKNVVPFQSYCMPISQSTKRHQDFINVGTIVKDIKCFSHISSIQTHSITTFFSFQLQKLLVNRL